MARSTATWQTNTVNYKRHGSSSDQQQCLNPEPPPNPLLPPHRLRITLPQPNPTKLHMLLQRTEWDFRAAPPDYDPRICGNYDHLPAEECLACYNYEITRNTPLVDFISKKFPDRSKQTFNNLIDLHKKARKQPGTSMPVWPARFFLFWPEWPEKPYLSIPTTERKRRLADSTYAPSAPPAGITPLPPETFSNLTLDLHKGISPEGLRFRVHLPGKSLEKDGIEFIPITTPGTREPSRYLEFAAIQIDYSRSDKMLLEAFGALLRERRRINGAKATEVRGPSSSQARYRSKLLALAAWRLTKVANKSLTQAIHHTKATSGSPLFAHRSAWSNASKKGELLVSQMRNSSESLLDR